MSKLQTQVLSTDTRPDLLLLRQVAEACEAPLWLLDQSLRPVVLNSRAQALGVDLTKKQRVFNSPQWRQCCQLAFQKGQAQMRAEIKNIPYHFSLSSVQQNNKSYLMVRAEAQKMASLDFRLLQQIIDFIPGAVFVKNRQHQWVLVNQAFCQLMGQAAEDLIGKSDFDFLPAEQADIFWAKDNEAFQSQSLSVNEECLTNSEGKSHWLLTQKLVFYSEDQEAFLVGVATDITQRKILEEQLEKACATAETSSMAKTEFLAKTSHEMRTSLNAILGFSRVLQKHVLRQPSGEVYLNRIHENGLHLLHLINDILDLSRIENGHMHMQYKHCDLNPLLEKIADTFQERIAEQNLTLKLVLTPLSLRTDPLRLIQVVSNLVDNAIKHTASGEIVLRTYFAQNDRFVIEVKDTGAGISPEMQRSIFDLFHQEDPASEGMGLGLAISRQICEKLGYQLILAESSSTGSCFQIHLKI